mgnify:CR=1 FL=1
MSDAIIGVIIGGIIASLGTWVSLWMQSKKWSIEQKVKLLTDKRYRIENLSRETLKKLRSGMIDNSYSSDMMSDIDFLFPAAVKSAFDDFMDAKADSPEEVKDNHAFYTIAREMKRSVKDIDDEIERLLN